MKNNSSFVKTLGMEIALFAGIFLFLYGQIWLSALVIVIAVGGVFLLRRGNFLSQASQTAEKNKTFFIGFTIFLLLLFPFLFMNNIYIIHIITLSFIYAIAILGLNFQIGSLGIVNFSQGALFGLGAYTSALLATNLGLNFWITLPAGIIVAGIFGFFLGLPSLKTKEYHLSLVTIAFAYVSYLLILNMKWTGGPDGIVGIPKPRFLGLSLARPLTIGSITIPGVMMYYFLVLLFLLIAIIIALRLHNSWVGLTWNAIRDDEIASRCYGINLTTYKLLCFVIGSMFAGASGVLYAHFAGFFSTESMAFSIGLLMVCMVILGGMDNIWGGLIGAILLVVIPEKFRAFQDFRLLFYGIILVVMLLFRPQGLFPNKTRKHSGIGE